MTQIRPRTWWGVTIGILMVKTHFRRFVGDIGNAETWPFSVQYRIVDAATPERMTKLHDVGLLADFVEAGRELVRGGADGIVTTCGFLSIHQQALTEALGVPVAASALLQAPIVERTLPSGKRVGILTYSAAGLAAPYLAGSGVALDTPIGGMPTTSEFVRSIRDGDPSVPWEVLRDEVVATARAFVADHPEVGALVFECTNLTPFSADVAEATGLPVFDAVTLVNWFHAGLRPRRFPPR